MYEFTRVFTDSTRQLIGTTVRPGSGFIYFIGEAASGRPWAPLVGYSGGAALGDVDCCDELIAYAMTMSEELRCMWCVTVRS